MTAQELTYGLLTWLEDQDANDAIPALLVTATKLAVGTKQNEDDLFVLGNLLALVSITFHDERAKISQTH